jgi:molecular chaperone Hsp33
MRDAVDDSVLPFQIGFSTVRGRVVRLGPSIDAILSAHGFAAPVSGLIGEAAALVAMLGSALKFDGRLIFQAQGDGPVGVIVADYATGGAVRATATLRGAIPDGRPGLSALLGRGHLAMTIDQGPGMERYQAVTALEGGDLAAAAEAHFAQSEQIPTALKLAVGRASEPGGRERWRAGGVMIQLVPGEGGARDGADDPDLWTRASALLQTTRTDEILDPSLAPEALLYRLYHEDGARVFPASAVRAECACSAEKVEAVLRVYSRQDLDAMVEDGAIRASCEFCRREFRFDGDGRTTAS